MYIHTYTHSFFTSKSTIAYAIMAPRVMLTIQMHLYMDACIHIHTPIFVTLKPPNSCLIMAAKGDVKNINTSIYRCMYTHTHTRFRHIKKPNFLRHNGGKKALPDAHVHVGVDEYKAAAAQPRK